MLGCAVGAGCLWLNMRPATRVVAAWLRSDEGSEDKIAVVVELAPAVIAEYPVLRLSTTQTGVVWRLVVLGKDVASSKDRILHLVAKLAQYDPKMTVFIQADSDVDMASLQDCIASVTQQGLHRFNIQNILWGESDIRAGCGVP